MLRDYLEVTKPGIVAGNLMSAAAGFALAVGHDAEPGLLAPMLGGIALVIAAACVLNNLLDRDLDRMMARTRQRALAEGRMRPRAALAYSAVLGLTGTAILLLRVDPLAVAVVLGGFAVYVGLYTVYLKRRSHWATVAGSLAGAAPPVAGYCAASGRLDAGAAWLALVFCLWQLPHFHAIAIRRLDDYRAAAVPVLAASSGVCAARRQMLACVVAFVVLTQFPPGTGGGPAYHVATVGVGLVWLYFVLQGGGEVGEAAAVQGTRAGGWPRRAFVASIVAITVLSAMISFDALTPDTPRASVSAKVLH